MKNPFIRLSASAVVQRDTDGRFLFIEESIGSRLVLDIPGGTWEHGETLQETSVREAAEEASVQFIPEHYLGCFVTEYTNGRGQLVCSVRTAFSGLIGADTPKIPRDPSTKAIYWFNLDEIQINQNRLRSSATLRCVQAVLNGRLFPLDFCDQAVDP